jgi:hypothetical protein
MSGAELNRLNGAVRFIELHRRPKRGLWCLHTNKATPRSTISAIQKRISRLQIEHGVRPYNVTTFETRGGLHAHIVFLGNREIAERLKSSTAFGEFTKSIQSPTRPGSSASILPRNGRRRRVTPATTCSVVAFGDHIASTAVATVCASHAI